MIPLLNWQEIQALAVSLNEQLCDLYLEQIIVPARPLMPNGFIKNEWLLRFSGKAIGSLSLLFSIRPRQPYIALIAGKPPKSATAATQSPFSLQATKLLCGSKVKKVHAVPNERMLILDFFGRDDSFTLVLSLKPSSPEALVIDSESKILASTRPNAAASKFSLPDGAGAPSHPGIRAELLSPPSLLTAAIERALLEEALEIRKKNLKSLLNKTISYHKKCIKDSTSILTAGLGQANAAEKGHELLASLYLNPDKKSEITKLAESHFVRAKKKKRQTEETQERLQEHQKELEKLSTIPIDAIKSIEELQKYELQLGVNHSTGPTPPSLKGKFSGWLGKTFHSKDGFTILVGRKKAENAELTFRMARGNDVWLHVKGKPGAHVVISIPSGKSAALETLLDAANLCLFYSDGKNWGKTEIDYTFKKFVKRTGKGKDSADVIYTHNKTLNILIDEDRLSRLLKQGGET